MKTINETLENLRVRYQSNSLDVSDCDQNPEKQFSIWLNEAISSQCDEPNAFTLSTLEGDQPRGRVVLLKGIKESGFVFYTNYDSDKGTELFKNPKASMTFLWLPLHRQVRIEGIITKTSAEDSDDYFHKRPRGSQLGAISSPQSQQIKDRLELEELFEKTTKNFSADQELPRPLNWGGYALKPTYVEFWQGRDNRMHDRIAYEQTDSGWKLYRLAP